MMNQPAFYRYFLAHSWLLSGCAGAALATVILFWGMHKEGIVLAGAPVFLWVILAAAPASLAGFVAGAFFLWMPIGNLAAWLQGWPFNDGEEVVVLSGKYKGTVAQVYESDVWKERGQVRLALGEEAKKSFTDIFCAVQVTRTSSK
ncbi:hypothetical protein [Botrimarina mediterranea]|uniref:Uncharacterized protein n=1 Tax=Botrimarina mediterranea TaxID=2528022 RepID=A0A518K2N7_9BACT|nr:hypothetical protein [Botrimarina mediterranea]QDV72063.1 hypothetical protein Spa11_02330 [Botrimarina mediterranea]QDV76604.1 hypothetical protein K2D_01830 [Planctomycetes bacterium K2D]